MAPYKTTIISRNDKTTNDYKVNFLINKNVFIKTIKIK